MVITSQSVTVHGHPVHYLDGGTGIPILFLHGNPTSSFLWRNLLPAVSEDARVIAVDLIGMGQSGKPDIPYRLQDHIAYIDGFIDVLGLNDLVLVLHDWGVVIGLDYLRRFPERVRAIAFMEGHIHPIDQWQDLDPSAQTMFQQLRDPSLGRHLIIDENMFIEVVLPSGIQGTLTDREMKAYRAPFLEPVSREPIWRWVQEIPIAGEPADVAEIVRTNQRTLQDSLLPKLLFFAQPGAVIGATEVAWCHEHCTNLTSINLGVGSHFLPEDHPAAIADGLRRWLHALDLTT